MDTVGARVVSAPRLKGKNNDCVLLGVAPML